MENTCPRHNDTHPEQKGNDKVSVLLSLYKHAKPEFLSPALESVFNQTRKPDEVVLIFDGPVGRELEEIVESFSSIHPELKIVKLPENRGLADSLNKGLKKCTYEFIARMDTDDIALPQRFERQLEYLHAHPEVHILGGGIAEFNSVDGVTGMRMYPEEPEDVRRLIHKGCPLAHPTVMMRKNIFDNGLRYSHDFGLNEDIVLWYDALLSGYKIANLGEVILKFRLEKDTFERRKISKALGEFRAYVRGIRKMDGILTLKYIYPFMRLCFRCMPKGFVMWMYNSKWRKKILGQPNKK